jgi:hypothetical protein
MTRGRQRIQLVSGILILALNVPGVAGVIPAFGVRAGVSQNPDQFVAGGMVELGSALGPGSIVPSVDFGFGDNVDLVAANLDLRFYLFPLPQTGINFYGAAGPTAVFANSNSEVGLSLTAGAKIPMKGKNRYNVEARFGVGDIPDLKVMLGILFGI